MPEAKAIQFLGYDDHAEVVPLVRQVYKRREGRGARGGAQGPRDRSAIGAAVHAAAEGQVGEASIRRISASGLQSLNPEAFEKAARRIVADEDDDDEIRATSLAALAHGREAREKPVDPKLVETVQKVSRRPAHRRCARRPALPAVDGE